MAPAARKFTEAQAWTYLAKKWDKPRMYRSLSGRLKACVYIDKERALGLCSCLLDLRDSGLMTQANVENMFQAAKLDRKSYRWARSRAGARARAAFCRRMAALARRKSSAQL